MQINEKLGCVFACKENYFDWSQCITSLKLVFLELSSGYIVGDEFIC